MAAPQSLDDDLALAVVERAAKRRAWLDQKAMDPAWVERQRATRQAYKERNAVKLREEHRVDEARRRAANRDLYNEHAREWRAEKSQDPQWVEHRRAHMAVYLVGYNARNADELRVKHAARERRWRAAHPQLARDRAKAYTDGRRLDPEWVEHQRAYLHAWTARAMAENPEKVRASARLRASRWHKKNAKTISAAIKMRRRTDPEWAAHERAYQVAWRGRNAVRLRQRQRAIRTANIVNLRAYDSAWKRNRRRTHPEKMREYPQRRRAMKAGSGWRPSAGYWAVVLAMSGRSCVYCGVRPATARELQQDHVIPLSRGGQHVPGNIVPACPTCNQRKGNRSVEELQRRYPGTRSPWPFLARWADSLDAGDVGGQGVGRVSVDVVASSVIAAGGVGIGVPS